MESSEPIAGMHERATAREQLGGCARKCGEQHGGAMADDSGCECTVSDRGCRCGVHKCGVHKCGVYKQPLMVRTFLGTYGAWLLFFVFAEMT